jgi:nitroreductase
VPSLDLATVDHLLSTTRAVRKRLDLARLVPPEVIEECLRLAIQAPTGSNSQGWRWIVVTDAAKRAALADVYRRGAEVYLTMKADELAAAGDVDRQTERVVDSALYLVGHLHEVPVHVIPCVEGAELLPLGNAAGAGVYGSIFPAVWSLQLALRSRGLGSVLTTLHLFNEGEAAELLGIPDGFVQVALLPVAYFTGDDFKPAERRPASEITYWDRWGQPRAG